MNHFPILNVCFGIKNFSHSAFIVRLFFEKMFLTQSLFCQAIFLRGEKQAGQRGVRCEEDPHEGHQGQRGHQDIQRSHPSSKGIIDLQFNCNSVYSLNLKLFPIY